mmetsp:Transcript_3798/g.12277  ORF Transcript_3798/g.12277 Transcript_3798/m.12277 type:complete len:314 (-) Transcript_3798:418-1359(-)
MGGMKSRGPCTIHRSPALRSTPLASPTPGSVNASFARRRRASSSPSTYTDCMLFSMCSPGWRKKTASPTRSSRWPHRGTPSSPIGFTITQNCRVDMETTSTLPSTTVSCTSGMWVDASLMVTSHSWPASRCLPKTSVNEQLARRRNALRSVRMVARMTPSTSSFTVGRYAPTFRSSHSSPASRATPSAVTNCRRARSFSAVLSCTTMARTTSTTVTSTRGMYVPGPKNIHSSPADRLMGAGVASAVASPSAASFFLPLPPLDDLEDDARCNTCSRDSGGDVSRKSRTARSCSAQSAPTTCSGATPCDDNSSPG